MDDRQPLPPAVERALGQSAELRRFAASAAAVELALRNSRPAPASFQGLHASIMCAVHSAEPARARAWPEFRSRLIPATALTLLLLLSVFGVEHLATRPSLPANPIGSSSLAIAASAVEISGQLVCDLPDAALSPLNQERLSLNRDLAGAQAFLLASLP